MSLNCVGNPLSFQDSMPPSMYETCLNPRFPRIWALTAALLPNFQVVMISRSLSFNLESNSARFNEFSEDSTNLSIDIIMLPSTRCSSGTLVGSLVSIKSEFGDSRNNLYAAVGLIDVVARLANSADFRKSFCICISSRCG